MSVSLAHAEGMPRSSSSSSSSNRAYRVVGCRAVIFGMGVVGCVGVSPGGQTRLHPSGVSRVLGRSARAPGAARASSRGRASGPSSAAAGRCTPPPRLTAWTATREVRSILKETLFDGSYAIRDAFPLQAQHSPGSQSPGPVWTLHDRKLSGARVGSNPAPRSGPGHLHYVKTH